MKASIITIGDELLIGQVVDTNSVWMAQELNKLGIEISSKNTISDKKEDIISNLDRATRENDLVFLTGGLGPTKDDITKRTLAEYFSSELVMNDTVLKHVTGIINKYKANMNDLNRFQAMVPDKCSVLFNDVGTAPGMMFQTESCTVFSMPGVPHEMKHIFTERIVPVLQNRSNKTIIHKTIQTIGIGEAIMAEMLEEWENSLPAEISLAYLPSFGKIRLRLSGYGDDQNLLKKMMQEEQSKLETILGEAIFSYNEESFEETVGKLLLNNGLTISTAESCTGGNIARTIASVPGASSYFKGSVVAYSNEIKSKLLGVKEDTLMSFGAVSEHTVSEMALGALSSLKTDMSIAVSGIAGPGGGTPDKPVGTIWIAVAYGKNKVKSECFHYRGNREFNINRTTTGALNLLRKTILEELQVKK